MKRRRQKKQLTRQEHIVSSSYLENFCDPKGCLFVYEKGREVRISRPEKECRERDFYEYEFRGRKTANACEDWLGEIENEAKSVLPLVLERRQLSQRQAITWASFVASLFAPTRKVRAQFSAAMIQRFRTETQRPEFVRDLQHQLLQGGELRYAADLQREIDELRAAMESEPAFYHVVGLPRKTAILSEALLHKHWHTISAPPRKFFVTSDCPVVTVARKNGEWSAGTGFGNENAIILLPLTPERVFFAVPAFMKVNSVVGPRFVDSTNLVVVRFAHRNIYAHVSFR